MNDKSDDPASGSWHWDKRVPVALIVTIAIQTGVFVFWAGTLSQRVTHLEMQDSLNRPQSDRIVRLETRMENIAEYIIEIRNLLRSREMRP